jgi:cell division septum initiation protein DivIVA
LDEDLRDIEDILEQVRDIVDQAKAVPLSASVMINREEILQLLDEVLDNLPDEFRKARWILKERDEVLERAKRDSEEILAGARDEARRMVEQQEIVKKAGKHAQDLLDRAKGEAREKILQSEDYIDQKLGQFEIALNKTVETVSSARHRLRRGVDDEEDFTEAPASKEEERFAQAAAPQHFDVIDQTGEHFFDQDDL